MSKLLIPFRIEALVLDKETQVNSPLADFSKLPGTFNNEQINPNTPYLGQVMAPNDNYYLPKGVHLHFIVPSFFGQTNNYLNKDVLEHPALPNRWIVKRNGTTPKAWLVESDYVHPEINLYAVPGNTVFGCIIPAMPGYTDINDKDKIKPIQQLPYRLMGRQTVLPYKDNYSETDLKIVIEKDATNFKDFIGQELTILGYGDINFASYYPNCSSSFGFYDSEISAPSSGLSYEVIGYFEDNNKDAISIFSSKKVGLTIANFNKTLLEELGLELPAEANVSALPLNGCILKSKIILDSAPTNQSIDKTKLRVAIGDTGSEALSALLATELANKDYSKENIEDQMESILLYSKLNGKQSDISAKLKEARHEKGFNSKSSQIRWSLIPIENNTYNIENPDKEIKLEQVYDFLGKTDIAAQLIKLNNAQEIINQQESEITSRKEQFYMDWCNYMKAKYDSKLYINLDDSNFEISLSKQKKLITTTTDQEIIGFKKEINDILNQSFNDKFQVKLFIQLKEESNDAYYSPNEPVLLIEGIDSLDKSLLENNFCQILEGDSKPYDFASLITIKETYNYSNQAAKPFLLSWQVSYYKSNLMPDKPDDQIVKNITDIFSLEEKNIDYTIDNLKYKVDADKSKEKIYNGLTIISDTTQGYYRNKLKEFINSKFKKEGIDIILDENGTMPPWETIKEVFKNKTNELLNENFDNPIYLASRTYDELQTRKMLTQCLSGFNNGCITRYQTPQLPIFDPFTVDAAIIKNWDDIINNSISINGKYNEANKYAPNSSFYFTPLISGNLTDIRISLCDNFGIKTLDNYKVNTVIKANSYKNPFPDPNSIYLKPRVVQKSRIEFKWMIGKDKLQSNTPIASPIIGWIVPNLLENEIMVYNPSGEAMGSINTKEKWTNVPNKELVDLDSMDPYLKNVIVKLTDNTSEFIDSFNSAQNNISPHNSIDTIDLIMDKPIAITRASIKLQLQGLPVLNQNMDAIAKNTSTEKVYQDDLKLRERSNWEKTKIAYRLGEHGQLSDGLIAYWFENGDTLTDKCVYPQTTAEASTNLTSFNDEETLVTMLIDPSSTIHITTGILPVKTISFLPEWYKKAIQNMEVWFKIGPIIQAEASSILLDLPEIEGYIWKWLNGNEISEEGIEVLPIENSTINAIEIKEGFLILNKN